MIALLLGLACIFNLILLMVIGGIFPSPAEVLRLVALVGLAFVYMSIFLVFSMMLSTSMKSSATFF